MKHISHRVDCKAFYGPRFEQMKYDQTQRSRQKNLERNRNTYEEKKKDSDANLELFFTQTEVGPEFVCICCHSSLDENEVLEFTETREEKIGPDLFKDCCVKKPDFYDPRGKGRYFICKYCFTHMTKKKTMPNRCINNGLTVEDIPESIADLTSLENSLIAHINRLLYSFDFLTTKNKVLE